MLYRTPLLYQLHRPRSYPCIPRPPTLPLPPSLPHRAMLFHPSCVLAQPKDKSMSNVFVITSLQASDTPAIRTHHLRQHPKHMMAKYQCHGQACPFAVWRM
ncbi:hypothetical protein PMIN04_012128 [Paraphaeosphaeria minitans]